MHACGKCNVKLEFLDISVGEGVILENRVKDFFTPYFIAYLCSISYFNSFMTSFLFAKTLTSTNRKIIRDPRNVLREALFRVISCRERNKTEVRMYRETYLTKWVSDFRVNL